MSKNNKQLQAYRILAEKGLKYLKRYLKRKYKDNLVALIVRGSYLTDDFKIGSDLDNCIVFKKNPGNNFDTQEISLNIKRFLKNQIEYKKSGAVPVFNFKFYLKTSLKNILEKDSHAMEIFRFGQLYYPKDKGLESYLKIDLSTAYLREMAEEDMKRPLRLNAKKLIKKSLYLGKQALFMNDIKLIKKEEIAKKFDKKFKKVSNEISLMYLYNNLNNLEELSLKKLINLSNDCYKFFVTVKNIFPK